MPSEQAPSPSMTLAREKTVVKAEPEPERPTSDSAAQRTTSPLSSVPSSLSSSPLATVTEMAAADTKKMGPPKHAASTGRKRSRDHTESKSTESSTNARAEAIPLASRRKPDDVIFDSTATMIPESSIEQQPSPSSGARSESVRFALEAARRKDKASQVTPPQSAQRDGDSDDDGSEPEDATVGASHEPVGGFDWQDLQLRYHHKLGEISHREAAAHDEFQNMMNYFTIWAQVGNEKEGDRGSKRLKTQITYVQHEEHELEKKRLHYIKVVEAFQIVGMLLGEPDWGKSIIANPQRVANLRQSVLTPRRRRRSKGRRESTKAIINTEQWKPYMVDDVDMQQYGQRDHHPSRCVIL